MFKNDFVVCVKVNDQVVREYEDIVLLPFGTEYTILLKNLRNERAVVKISIDGADALHGDKLVVNGNSELNLERFLESNTKGHRFKFIKKTEKISQHRGDKPEDGILRVEYQFERKPQVYEQPIFYTQGYNLTGNTGQYNSTGTWLSGNVNTTLTSSGSSNNVYVRGCTTDTLKASDAGITGYGNISEQKFQNVYVGSLENVSHVITLQLKGKTSEPVAEVITVRTKLICDLCGTKNKSSAKYCGECGNNLVQI